MTNENQLARRDSGEMTIIEASPEIMPPSAIESMQRAEIDVQISTAHRFPRSMQKFKQRAVEMATMDEETAASCLYSRPVGGGKFAEGLSVRTAEIVGACYGNLRVAAMVVEQTERYVKARGMAHDLETNFASACEVIESTVKRDGTPYDERMRIVIAKACLAKARRDATFQVVPKALCKPIEAAARAVAIGDAQTLGTRRGQALQWAGKLGIDIARVFAALGVKGEEDLGLEELKTLTGVRTAIKDGEVTIDEAFPALIKEGAIGNRSPLAGAKKTPAKDAAAPTDEQKPKDTAGPSAADLLADLTKRAKAEFGMGKSVLQDRLTDHKFIVDTLDSLDANTLDGLLAQWDEIKAALATK